MSGLSAFLKENAKDMENIKFVASKRFVDEKNKPVEWELRCITAKEDDDLRASCTRKVPVNGKRGQSLPETDITAYLGKLCAYCVVFPNLKDKDLQDSYGVMGDDALLKTMLKSGEYSELVTKIQEINGFDITMEEKVEEAKN